MIERISTNIARKINYYDPTSDVEIMEYGLKIILNLLSVVLICFIVGSLIDKVGEIFLAFFAFAILRMFSGGFHFKSLDICAIVSACIFISIPIVVINNHVINMLNIVSLIIVLFRAPVNIHSNTKISMNSIPYFKIISIIIVAFNLLIGSSVIALSFFVQALTLFTKRIH
ncbi:accessory gene regulator B family protein [Chengkuizengella axinellae]|uniref:Accessory gene regulator B family protein n=1 Tax=Chengkuizengella axinellae TaxID=3064388 RepID=A0ABT9IT76_9BACL|nr:accessory gene regulator B family protein [Chengkuizengella sp. 2205SS18-9]MDP5272556.1 accessory gene regulator B family protein [Chengkuizengella sp. 2205SS18-9]